MYNSLAALENPKSETFMKAVHKEQTHWAKSLKPLKHQTAAWESAFRNTFAEAMPAKPEYANESINDEIFVQHTNGHRMNVWLKGKQYSGVTNFGIDESGLYYCIRDVGQGAETMELCVCNQDHEELWKTSPVGPDAVFTNQMILYQTVENQLRYPGIIVADKYTGRNKKQIFEEKDKRYQIELSQPPNQSHIFIKRQNTLDQQLAIFNNGSFTWFTPQNRKQSLFPISKGMYATNTDLHIDNKQYPLLPNEYTVDAMLYNNTILYTTTKQARMSLYAFDIEKKQVSRIWGKDFPCDIKLRKRPTLPTIEIGFPHKSSTIYTFQNNQLKQGKTFPEPVSLQCKHGFAKSNDGTMVPYTLVQEKHTNPKRLFVEGYGSYGISSRRSYPIQRLAWLQRGYAYAVSFARGGREDGDRWWDGGRTALRKQNTFDDTAAVIQTLQQTYNFSQGQTIFYGRSAGGLLAANIAQQYPQLTRAIYAEVPYLDVVRTTSNPNLPLTQMEYDEFGDPAKRPNELQALLQFSPVDTVPEAKKNSPIILVKTALHDSQVLPYETLKWATKLRKNNHTVYVGIDGGGHFVEEKNLYRGLAEDAAILDHALRAQSSRGTRRRKWSSSKHFTRHRTSSRAE